jgi:hypothetical protein
MLVYQGVIALCHSGSCSGVKKSGIAEMLVVLPYKQRRRLKMALYC